MAKVKIACHLSSGVKLHLFKAAYDDGTGSGYKPIWRHGEGVVLAGAVGGTAGGVNSPDGLRAPGITEVDEEWWNEWFEQNKDISPLLGAGLIHKYEEPPPPPPEPAPVAQPSPAVSAPHPEAVEAPAAETHADEASQDDEGEDGEDEGGEPEEPHTEPHTKPKRKSTRKRR